MWRKSIQRIRHERKVKKCAAMRSAKDRKRLAQAQSVQEVGQIVFSGLMFGGEHTLRCLDAGDGTHLLIEIDGQAHKPKSWRGVMRMVCKRLTKNERSQT